MGNAFDELVAGESPHVNDDNLFNNINTDKQTSINTSSPVLPQIQQKSNPVTTALGNVLKGTGGAVMGLLEKLDRPRSMLVAGVQAIKGDRKAGDILEAAKGNIHPSWSETLPDMNVPIPSILKGHKSDIDVNNEGKTANVKNAVGFLGDVALDPINALGVGVLTKGGKAASVLKKIGEVYGDDILRGIINNSDEAVKFLKSKGVSDDFLKLALNANAPLAKTLPEQAKVGQWAAGKLGPLTTPKSINIPIAKVVDKTSHTLPKVPIVNKFINRTGYDDFDEGLKRVDFEHKVRQNKIIDTGKEARKVIDTSDFGDMSSASWYEKGGADATPSQQIMKERIFQLNQNQVADMKSRGIPIEQISEDGYYYVPHVETEEEAAKKFVDITTGKAGPKTKTPQAIQRQYAWIKDPETGEEVLDHISRFAAERELDPAALITRQATVDEINKSLGGNKFRGDLAEATTIAAMRNEAAIHGADQIDFFLNHAKKNLGDKTPEEARALGWRTPAISIPERYMVKDGKTFKLGGKVSELQNTFMPPEIARVVESRWKMSVNPEESVKKIKEVYDGYISAWKRYTLFLFPEYHTRNMVGDIWNGWMQGWKPKDIPFDIKDAIQISRGKPIRIKSKLYGDLDGETILKMARDHGVIGTGQWSEVADLIAPIESAQGKTILQKIKKEAWDLDKPTKVGEFLENNRRLALFKRLVQDGDTFEGAAKSVAKTLYDYNDLTDTERQIRRLGIPFYTWYRKNIPAQFENLVRRPGKVSVLPKMKAAIEGSTGTDYPEEARPEWMRRDFSIHTGSSPDGKENLSVLGGYIPTTDVLRYGGRPEDTMSNIASNLNPLIKIPLELSLNKNFFRNTHVDQLRDQESGTMGALLGNERTNFLGVNMPTSVAKFSELLPVTRALSTADRMNPFGMFDQYPQREDGKTRPYHTELDTGQKLTKFITGFKDYPQDVEKDMMYKMQDLKYETERLAGLNVANIKAAMRRAMIEGDEASVDKYMKLLEIVSERADKQMEVIERYEQSKR